MFLRFPILLLGIAIPATAAMIDLDGNGLSDLWQRMHPGLNAADDDDGDGFSNGTEAVAGTDPLDPECMPRLEVRPLAGNQPPLLRWDAFAGKSYAVESWNAASNQWQELLRLTATATSPFETPVPGGSPAAILRLRIRDVDQDGDGLNAWEEHLLGYSDASMHSSGITGRLDFSDALRRLEGTGTLTLTNEVTIPQRPTTRSEASRFLTQATFGPDPALIDEVAASGIGPWIDLQLNHPNKTVTSSTMLGQASNTFYPLWWGMGWWKAAMTAPDQIRLRTANAFSQILVVSTAGNDLIRGNSFAQADYFDIFIHHAFGNYRNMLEEVTYSNQMGFYLSHLYNRKADPTIGRFPDENFAREIMQLFTIGLWELHPDGSRKLDAYGKPIPTYDNTTIMEMAKVFTGFGFGGPASTNFFSPISGTNHYRDRMILWDDQHEPGEKHIISGVVIPAGQTGNEDVSDALDALCQHPNTAPFLSRLLIQRFTSSSPSPRYIHRVATAWENNGAGIRGDLKAVIDAILMDPEARTPEARGDASGKVREPFLRLTALARAFTARNKRIPPTFSVWQGTFPTDFGQLPLNAPSVFNYYLPDHRPAGELRSRGLFAPELEIATADRMIRTDNRLNSVITNGIQPLSGLPDDALTLDFSIPLALAESSDTIPALIQYLDELLTWGAMSHSTRATVTAATQAQTTAITRVRTAVHLIIESPDFVVLK